MFLKKLFHFNKVLCIVLVFFFASFCFINYKHGLVAAPVFQYGMYSDVFHKSDTQEVYHFYVNDKMIDLTKYDFANRDNILATVSYYKKSKQSNLDFYATIKRIFNKIGLGKFMLQDTYTNKITDEQFMDWYKKYLEHIIDSPIDKLVIYSQLYAWQSDFLKPVSTPEKIFSFGIN